jgi:riboflavin kinase/FMN adenylyltransferase
MVLQEHSDIKLLNTIDEKNWFIRTNWHRKLVIHPFDEAFSRLTAEEFVRNILVDRFHIQKIIITITDLEEIEQQILMILLRMAKNMVLK